MVNKFYNSKNAINDDFCIGSIKRHRQVLNIFEDFMHAYNQKKKHIVFMHYIENSHDHQSRINWLDNDLYTFLSTNFEKNLFNNTAIFLYSDHGARFTDRRSMQRYLEERLPFFSIFLPDWYKKAYKTEHEHLLRNKRQLTSPFDIHATVRHLTCLDADEDHSVNNGENRAQSLLRQISQKRSCKDIGISEHYCTCIKPWLQLNLSEEIIKEAVQFSVDSINKITTHVRSLCVQLKLMEIISAEKLTNIDLSIVYKIEFQVTPSQGIYEVLVHAEKSNRSNFEFNSNKFGIKSRQEISRIDAYGEQPSCVADFANNPIKMLDLRKFCFCKRIKAIKRGFLRASFINK